MQISKLEIDSIIEKYDGHQIFQTALHNAGQSSLVLVQLLAQYIQFNSIFGAGVANLAGELAGRQDMFRDPNEPMALIADRSSDVAAAVFYAAIDEFAQKKTHRRMAQETLREAVNYRSRTRTDSDYPFQLLAATQIAISEVARCYCLNRSSSEADLFRGIGFHIGSELLADAEFNILDSFLMQHRKELVSHLKEKRAYAWVAVHTSVEAEHFDSAMRSAKLALDFYTGNRQEARLWILNGLKDFANIQSNFMHALLQASAGRQENGGSMVRISSFSSIETSFSPS